MVEDNDNTNTYYFSVVGAISEEEYGETVYLQSGPEKRKLFLAFEESPDDGVAVTSWS